MAIRTRRRRRVLYAILLIVVGAFAYGTFGYFTSRPSQFCKDTDQLQMWQATSRYSPGVDQWKPDRAAPRALLQPQAAYLTTLAGEAPPDIQPDLVTWAAFASDYANGAPPASLAPRFPAAQAAVANVRAYLQSGDHCEVLYEPAQASKAEKEPSVRDWGIRIGVGFIAFVIVVSVIGSITGSGGGTGSGTSAGGRSSSGDDGLWGGSGWNQPRKCYRCGGHGTCTACSGNNDCSYCGGSGRCASCGGTGTD